MVIILYKGGKKQKDKLNSYRGITLLPTINKIFEKCIAQRMEHFVKLNRLPPELQYASKKAHSTVSLSYAVQEAIQDQTEHGGKVFACFLDISQAFDRIWINGLLYKLFRIGIVDKLWLLIKDWFTNNVCSILLNGVITEPFNISRSIKQGGILSMFFFAISFYDVHDYIKQPSPSDPVLGLKCGDVYIGSPAYADDLLLLCNTVNGLNNMLDRAYMYSKQWRLSFSPIKSKCTIFGETQHHNVKNLKRRKFYLGEDCLDEVTNFKHLGIDLCAYNCTKQRTHDICNKAIRALSGLTAIGVHETGLLPQISVCLWNKICITAMLYGSEIWHELPKYQLSMLEKTQVKVLKRAQGLPLRTHDAIVLGLVGQRSIQSLIDQRKLYFLQNLVSGDIRTVHKRVFTVRLYQWLCGMYKYGYVPDIFYILIKYDLLDYFMTYVNGGRFPNKLAWKAIVKDATLQHQLTNDVKYLSTKKDVPRYLDVHKKGFYLLYKVLKMLGLTQQDVLYRSQIRAMAKFIAIPVQVEYKPCQLCGIEFNDVVEHVFMRCMYYIDDRNDLWDKILDRFGLEIAVDLFQYPEEECLNIFLGKSYIKRKENIKDFYKLIAQYGSIFAEGIKVNIPWFK